MKFRLRFVAAALAGLAMLLPASALAQSGAPHLKVDDTLPTLDGQSLTGKWLVLPAAASEHPAVVTLSFSRTAGRDAQSWAQHLSNDYPHLAVYTVIFLESVPGLFRPAAVSGIKGKLPVEMQDRAILLYRDESFWRQRLRVTDESNACVILLGSKGQIRWMTSGPFEDALYLALSKQIRTAN